MWSRKVRIRGARKRALYVDECVEDVADDFEPGGHILKEPVGDALLDQAQELQKTRGVASLESKARETDRGQRGRARAAVPADLIHGPKDFIGVV